MNKAYVFLKPDGMYLIPELPQEPMEDGIVRTATITYRNKLAEAKANALKVVNPEIVPSYVLKFGEEFHEWPGTWELQHLFTTGIGMHYAAKLIAPQPSVNSGHGYSEGGDVPTVNSREEKTINNRLGEESLNYADSVDRRGTSHRTGLVSGFIAGAKSERNKVLGEAIESIKQLYNDDSSIGLQSCFKVVELLESLKIKHL